MEKEEISTHRGAGHIHLSVSGSSSHGLASGLCSAPNEATGYLARTKTTQLNRKQPRLPIPSPIFQVPAWLYFYMSDFYAKEEES